jgi:lipopolysaccharide export LptBFGC system permease protein LptF
MRRETQIFTRLDGILPQQFIMKPLLSKSFAAFVALLALTLSATLAVAAENATGNWKWSITTQNGDTFESTAKLKQDGDKVTGTVNGRFGEAEIQDGSVKGDDIKFKVKRERDGQTFVLNYSGKISTDKIKGKIEFERDGNTVSRDWDAKRDGGKSAAGAWNTALILPDGNRIEGVLNLKQEGDKVTGTVKLNQNETQIQEGKVKGDEVSFIVKRDRDGRTVTSKYKLKLNGDALKGKVESDWSGDWQTLDWEATRAK